MAKMVSGNEGYDCAVIGAGPGGCTAAALVAQQGFKTLLVERDKMPRFHVGESLMPETFWTFERLGIVDELNRIGFTRKNGVQFVNDSDKETKPFLFERHDPRECSRTWHVQRADFDQLLYETAGKTGATCFDETRVVDISIGKNPPHKIEMKRADGKEVTVSAKVVVDASGQQSLIASRLKLKQMIPNLKKAAIWGYFKDGQRNGGSNDEVTCILHTDNKLAWFWYIPLSDGTISVGLVGDNTYLLKRSSSPMDTFEEERQRCPGLIRRLRDAEQIGRLHIAKEFSYTTTQHAGDGWVLVGDAYGFIDPIYSSGVFLACKSGEWAADAICDGLRRNDLSAEQLGIWTPQFDSGVALIRKLVEAFYTKEFSFGEFMKEHPEHAGNLTDLLIGRVFDGAPGKIFDDMDPWIEKIAESVAS